MSYFSTKKSLFFNLSIFIGALAMLANCAHRGQSHDHHHDHEHAEAESALHADANLSPKSGNKKVAGDLHFKNEDGSLMVTGVVSGLKPNTSHGFHIHEIGDCSAKDAKSAGGHFSPNPKNKHGAYTDQNRHAGDLGNLKSDKDGSAQVELTLPGLNLIPGDTYSAIGRAVIVHSKADDFTSQPSGNAGDRIACGVIEKVEH